MHRSSLPTALAAAIMAISISAVPAYAEEPTVTTTPSATPSTTTPVTPSATPSATTSAAPVPQSVRTAAVKARTEARRAAKLKMDEKVAKAKVLRDEAVLKARKIKDRLDRDIKIAQITRAYLAVMNEARKEYTKSIEKSRIAYENALRPSTPSNS